MKCPTCGEEHELLDPAFRRPEAVVGLSDVDRAARVKESDDLCAIWADSDAEPHRFFVRCVLNVALLDAEQPAAWGLWAEVAEPDFKRIVEKWADVDQASLPPMLASIANRVPGYPDTVGLPAALHLTGPATRPVLTFAGPSPHPFVQECERGVCTHRVMDWLEAMR
jgi:hypothetical protein